MSESLSSYAAFGPSVERPAWSWSYLRRPTVLCLWLACAAVCAFLADRTEQPDVHAPAESAHAPRHHGFLHVVQGDGQPSEMSEPDEDARAA